MIFPNAPAASAAPATAAARFDTKGNVFGLAMRTGFLSLITLGIYRFWAKTRIRQYFWGKTTIGGDAFEYTGTGLEKFLGFLVAVVVLAVYLAAVQLILFQFGLYFIFQPKTQAEILMQLAVIYLSLFAILPLILFAQYRSRRYKLARTRFRGIRFGMAAPAGGYVWRGLLYIVLTILTLGLLWPLMTFRLEKYMTDRSWFGDTRFEQGGKWTGLYRPMMHMIIAVGIIILGAVLAVTLQSQGFAVAGMFIGYIWGIIGYVSYRVQGFAYLTNHKTLGPQLRFETQPRTGRVLADLILGSIIISIVIGVVAAVGGFILAGVFKGGDPQIALIIGAIAYLLLLILAGALSLAYITEPIIAHVIGETRVLNPEGFDTIRQRATDKGADAEGFADALDWGGAI
ncbi:MAG: DUF898 family protein [Paracoccaceae bacterium]